MTASRGFMCCLIDRGIYKRQRIVSLNSDFVEQILHQRCIDAEIAVAVSRRCSLCWVSKVYVAESLRFSCLLVCVNSASRRGGWSLCLVQILYGQVVDIAGGGQWGRRIGGKSWMIDGSKYCYVIPIILFLHAVKRFQAFPSNRYNCI